MIYRQCCVCQKFMDKEGKEIEVELTEDDEVTHTYCEFCLVAEYERMQTEISQSLFAERELGIKPRSRGVSNVDMITFVMRKKLARICKLQERIRERDVEIALECTRRDRLRARLDSIDAEIQKSGAPFLVTIFK